MIFSELITKYDLRPNSYVYTANFDHKYWFDYLFYKWKPYIAENHYAFQALVSNEIWYRVIDEMLEIIKVDSPNFKIVQIKVKVGGIRIHLENIFDKVFYGVQVIEQVLYDESLIY